MRELKIRILKSCGDRVFGCSYTFVHWTPDTVKISQGGTGVKRIWWRHPPDTKTQFLHTHLFSYSFLDKVSCWWGSSSRETVLQMAVGTEKGALTGHIWSQGNKNTVYDRGEKEALGLYQYCTAWLCCLQSQLSSALETQAGISFIQAAATACKLEVGQCNQRWQV